MNRIPTMKPQSMYFTPIRLFIFALLMILLWVMLVPHTFAATGIRRTINFQGKIVNKTSGTNITDGSYSFTFKFYDASTAGTQLPSGAAWSETQTLTVTNGIFRAELGSSTAIPTTLDFNQDNIYLDITFNSETFGSRVRMTAVPYAFNAEKVNGLTVTATTGTFTLANAKTLTVNNTLTIAGTDSTTLTFQGTDTYVGRATTDTLTNKTIGSTGLVFSGAATDITTATDEHLVITPNGTGNVGIGTTAPTVKLDVVGSARVSGTASLNGNVVLGDANTDTLTINAGSSGSGITFGDSSFATCTALETSSGVLTCGTDDGGGTVTLTADNAASSFTTALTLSGGTNGIDTSVSGSTVTFNMDTTEIGTTTFGSGSGITWTFDASGGTDPTLAFGSSSMHITAGTASFSGNLGIGTTVASAKLHIIQEAAGSQAFLLDAAATDSTTTTGVIDFNIDTTTAANIGFNIDYAVKDAAANVTSAFGQKLNLTVDTDAAESHTVQGLNITVANNDATSTATGLYVDAGTGAGTEYAAVFMNGNVGIGTTAPSGNLLHIAGSSPALRVAGTTGSLELAIADGSGSYSNFATSSDAVLRANTGDLILTAKNASGLIRFGTGNGDTTDEEVVTISSAGNLGVGTSAPTGRLQVVGDEVRIGDTGNVGSATADGDLYIEDLLEVDGNVLIGDANTDTLTINAGSSGSGISFGDSSFATCTALETAGGVLTCGTDDGGASGWTDGGTSVYLTTTTDSVGIGTTAPIGALHIQKTNSFGSYTDSRETAVSVGTLSNMIVTDTGVTSPLQANLFDTKVDFASDPGSKTVNGLMSLAVIPSTNSTTASSLLMRGLNFTAQNAGTGTIGTIVGMLGGVVNSNTGTITNARAVDAIIQNSNASGTISNAYGINVSALSNTGTITNTYGVHVGDITTGTQTNTPFSFYASDANAYNYFAGNVGIGTTTPGSPLSLNKSYTDTASASYYAVNVAPSVNPASASLGLFHGVRASLSSSGAQEISRLTGGYFQAYHNNTATTNSGLTQGYGGHFIFENVTTGKVSTAASGRFDMSNSSTGTISTAYGLQLSNLTNAGTITNTYGVHIGDITTGTQTNTPFSFYASDANAYNYFAGNVGIGTTAPQQLLGLYTTSTPYVHFGNNITGQTSTDGSLVGLDASGNLQLKQQENLAMTFFTNNTEYMRISAAGNVGIGTTAPGQSLEIRKDQAASTLAQVTNTNGSAGAQAGFQMSNGTDTALMFLQGTGQGRDFYIDNLSTGQTWFRNRNDSWGFNFQTGSSPTTKVTITNGGNVGIGTTNPGAKLEVTGASGAALRLSDGTFATCTALETDAQGDVVCGTDDGTASGWTDGGTDVYLTTLTDEVGIGTTAPASALHIVSTATDSSDGASLKIASTGSSTTNPQNGIYSQITLSPGSASTQVYGGVQGLTYTTSANASGATLYGVIGQGAWGGGAQTGTVAGGFFYGQHQGSGAASTVVGVRAVVQEVSSGSITDARGVYIVSSAGSIGTNYGLYIDSQTVGTSDYGIRVGGADTAAINIIQSSAGGQSLLIDAATTDSTTTTGVFDLNVDTVTNGNVGLNVDYIVRDAAGDLSAVYGQKLNLTVDTDAAQSHRAQGLNITVANNDATSTAWGLYVDAGAGAGTEYAAAFINGNVGVGLTNPEGHLQVSGSVATGAVRQIIQNTSGTAPQAELVLGEGDSTANTLDGFRIHYDGSPNTISFRAFSSDAAGTAILTMDRDDYSFVYNLSDVGDFRVQDAGADVFTVTDGGLVGIGTTAPGAKLDVTGASGAALRLSDASFASCTALETDAQGDVICGTDDTGSGGSPDTARFIDSTSLPVFPNPQVTTTELWNDTTRPNITPTATSQTVMININIGVDFGGTSDSIVSARVVREDDAASTTPSCDGTDPQVGSYLSSNFGSNADDESSIVGTVLDSPSSTSAVYYTVCTSTQGGGTTTPAATHTDVFLVVLGADLAENYYTKDSSIEAGHIVSIDSSLPAGAKKSMVAYEGIILGVVSTAPGKILDDRIGADFGRAIPIALSGRVPVRVTAQNGAIEVGDFITSSSIAGVGMRATRPGRVVGQAMTGFSGEGIGTVMLFANTQYVDPGLISEGLIVESGNLEKVRVDEGKKLREIGAGLETESDIASASTVPATLSAELELAEAGQSGILNVKGLIVEKNAEFKGEAFFAKLATFLSNVIFKGSVLFEKVPTFNKDTAGFAQINRGERYIDIHFDEEYIAEPVVTVSVNIPVITDEIYKEAIANGSCILPISLDECREKLTKELLASNRHYAVSRKSTKGFVIELDEPATANITFSWIAVAVKDVKMTKKDPAVISSLGDTAGISTPSAAVQADQEVVQTASASSEIRGAASVDQRGVVGETELGYVRLRTKPSLTGDEIGQVPTGTDLSISAIENGWYQVQFDGKSGWVSGEYIKK